MKSDLLATFRAQPEAGSRLYYTVRIFASRAAARRWKRDYFPSDALAMCGRYVNGQNQPDRSTPEIGHLLFLKRHLKASVFAHECVHAALGWMDRIGIMSYGKTRTKVDEERFCYAIGRMVQRIGNECMRRGLLK